MLSYRLIDAFDRESGCARNNALLRVHSGVFMKKKRLNYIVSTAFGLFFLDYSNSVLAHTQSGSLGESANATDFYVITCGEGSDRLETQVRNITAKGPLVSVQAHSENLSSHSTDPVSGDTDYGPAVPLNGGGGAYYVTVDKAGAGEADYSMQFHCMSGITHTETAYRTLQDDGVASVSPAIKPELVPTVIKDEVRVESETLNAVVVGQGCRDPKGKVLPVIAQSVLFPTVNPKIYKSDAPLGGPSSLTLGDILSTPAEPAEPESGIIGTPGYLPAKPQKSAEPITSLANIVHLISSNDVMKLSREKKDALGNSIGFESFKGKLDSSLHGVVPFMTSALPFKADSCAKSLIVKVAIADICKKKFPPVPGSANLWMPNTTAKFPNAVDGTSTTAFGGMPSTLTFVRPITGDPAKDLNETACGGPGYDVYVYPSEEDIDANLPIKKFWGK